MSRISAPFPERVGWYELLAPIGAGGMATVYLGMAAHDGSLGRYVAVKMIHGTAESDAQLAADLLKEAKLVARIRHPNVVPVLDVGEDPNGLFLVMEYVEGDTLAGLRRAAKRLGERIPEPIALRIVTEALAGLHAAHDLKDPSGASLGVVHRDFSPHNILVGTDGVSRLTDFGIAKVAYTAGHTRTGRIKGKIAYMSPEQARGTKVDQRCDVWAAGVVAWEALVGDRLYDTDDEIGALLKIVNEDPPRLSGARPDLPAELDEAMHWALTRDLDARCPSADALRRRFLAAHPVADTAEVAEFVRRITGPKLADRAKKVEEIRRVRSRGSGRGEPAPSGGSPPWGALDAPSGAFALETEAAEPDATQARPREDTTGATIAWKEQGSGSHASGNSAVTNSVERSITAMLADRRNRAAIIGVASGVGISLVLAGVVLVSIKGRGTPPDAAKPSVVAAAAAPSAANSVEFPHPLPPVGEQTLTIRANSDIATLKVGDKTIPIQPPAPEVEIDGLPDAGVSIEATSSDGRKARRKLSEGSTEVTLEFGKRPVVVGGGGPVKPPVKGGGGFAENPYKKK